MDVEQGAPQGFDLTQFEMTDTGTLTLRNQQGNDDFIVDGQPVTVEVYSPGSKQGVRALHRAGLALAARLTRQRRGELDKRDAEKADEERVDKLVGFTKGFSSNFPALPEDVYSNPKLNWITRQIEEHVDKEANFSKGSLAS